MFQRLLQIMWLPMNLKVMNQFGIDYVTQAFDRMIEESKMMCKKMIQELPEGKWTTALYLDTTGIKIKPRKVQTTLIKEEMDFLRLQGPSPGTWLCTMCLSCRVVSSLRSSRQPTLLECSLEHRYLQAIEYNLPRGSLVNVELPYAVFSFGHNHHASKYCTSLHRPHAVYR